MTKLFLSIDFANIKLARQIRDELKYHGVEGVIAGDLAEAPPPDVIRSLILSSDGLLAIFTSEHYDWIQNEIGIAYAADLPIWALVKKDIKPGGLLRGVTTYVEFRPWEFDLKKTVAVIANELRKSGGILAVVDRNKMLSSSSGIMQLAIRPRRIPSGDEMITVYIPPEFIVSTVETPKEIAEFIPELPRKTTTEIPSTACDITISHAGDNDAYPHFWKIDFLLKYPQIKSYLNAGWAEFKLNVTAPATSGKYQFFGEELVSIARHRPQDASSFEFEPIVVQGELFPLYLSGIIFTSPGVPLNLPGVVWAIMTSKIDPYTGQQITQCPPAMGQPSVPGCTNAMCYIAASDKGKYEMSGVAPGVYDVYAAAMGFSIFVIASGLKIHKQPESLDGTIQLALTTADNAAIRMKVDHALKLEQEYRSSLLHKEHNSSKRE